MPIQRTESHCDGGARFSPPFPTCLVNGQFSVRTLFVPWIKGKSEERAKPRDILPPLRMDADLMCAASVVGFVTALSLLARSTSSSSSSDDGAHRGRELLAQSAEWLRLSEQDGVPLFSYRHAAFALAYLNAARLVAPDRELQRVGTDVHLLHGKLEARLTSLARKIGKTCASSNPGGAKPTAVSWV